MDRQHGRENFVPGGRDLQPGDYAYTDYNGPGTRTRVKILERDDSGTMRTQSGVLYRVEGRLRNHTPGSWYDADWFEAETQQ